ncbi:MAG: DUF3592 domain-containing protein [Acutalibacteraceae bacterium]
MSKENKVSTIMPIVIAIILIAIGTVGLTIVITDELEDNEFFNNAETCTALVNSVHTYTTRSSTRTGGSLRSKSRTTYTTTTHHDAYVSYTINGVNYDNVKIPNVPSSVKKGDPLTLYYNPQKPGYVCIKSDSTYTLISLCILSAFVLGGIVIIVMEIISVKRKSKKQPQLSAQDVIPDANSTSAAYNGYNSEPQYYSDSQNMYDPNQTYTGYEENSFDTYSGYSPNDNSNSFNSRQSSPFDASNVISQNDGSKPKSPFDKYK